MKTNNTRFAGIVSVLWCLAAAGQADSISFFRHDLGRADNEAKLPDRFDLPENLLWKQPLDSGHSTPCVFGDAIFLTTFQPDQKELATVALDRATGTIRWKQVATATQLEAIHPISNQATATPAADEDRVYVYFGSYGLIAYVHAGAIVWQQKLGPFQDEYGAPSSPIIVDDKVILNQDHDVDNALYAFHRVDGRIVWQIPRDDFTRSYSTPAVLRRNGRSEIVVAGSLQLAAYDSERGEKLWWVDGLARIVNPVPVVADEWIYVAGWTPGGDSGQRIKMEPWRETVQQFDANGDGKISRHELVDGEVLTRFFRIDVNQDQMLSQAEWERHAVVFDRARNSILAVRPAGIGDLTASSIRWEYDRGIPYVPSPLLYQDIVYMVKDGGILTSLASRTGEPLKQARLQTAGSYYASPAAGDGKIYLASESGVVTVVRADGQWQIISTHDFGEPIYATPVIRDGRVYVRTAAALYCFGRK